MNEPSWGIFFLFEAGTSTVNIDGTFGWQPTLMDTEGTIALCVLALTPWQVCPAAMAFRYGY